MEIYRLPKVLIIHLKRFKEKRNTVMLGMSKTAQMEKDGAMVRFPIDKLDMRDHVAPAIVDDDSKNALEYEFLGVCNHMGSLDGGHYTAFINYKNMSQQGRWIKFDDHYASELKAENIETPNAYVLFYKHSKI